MTKLTADRRCRERDKTIGGGSSLRHAIPRAPREVRECVPVSARCLNVDKPRLAANSRLIRLRLWLNDLDVTETRSPRFVRSCSYGLVLWSRGTLTPREYTRVPSRQIVSIPIRLEHDFSQRIPVPSTVSTTFIVFDQSRGSRLRSPVISRGTQRRDAAEWYNSLTRPE